MTHHAPQTRRPDLVEIPFIFLALLRLRASCPSAAAFREAVAQRNSRLSTQTGILLTLLDRYGPARARRSFRRCPRPWRNCRVVSRPHSRPALQATTAKAVTATGDTDDPRAAAVVVKPHALAPYDKLARGYLSFNARNADLLFQVVSRRYEKRGSCSLPISRSRTGSRSSPMPSAPLPSSTALSTTPTSSPSKVKATDYARPKSVPQDRRGNQATMTHVDQFARF